ncbi:MAG: beta-lactamase family protein [Bacteroidales bacterium]|nr:beta-lactamase family protein [Bacteroidales bacterium]
MRKAIFFVAIFFSVAMVADLSAQTAKRKKLAEMSVAEIEKIFETENERLKEEKVVALAEEMSDVFNGSMIISRGKKMLVKTNYGYKQLCKNSSEKYRDREENLITFSTFFELASVSKQFTAVAILTLVEADKLSLDDTLRKFFPELPYHNITIHNLLTHTSGLTDYIDFPDDVVEDEKILIGNKQMTEIYASRHEPVKFAPGTKFEYTNTNYMLMAQIVEMVSGKAFEDYVREKVFLPAGMTNSFYISEETRKSRYPTAIGHKRDGQVVEPHFTDGTVGDKGLYSSAEELFLWKKAFFDDHKILSDKMREMATTQQNRVKGKNQPTEMYGYGFRLEESVQHGKVIYHGGLWHGFQHLFFYRPKDDLVLIFLTNWRNSAHLGKSGKIMHILDGA